MENSIAVPQKTKHGVTIWSSKPSLGHPPKQNHNSKDMGTPVFTAARFTTARTRKQLRRPRQMNKEDKHTDSGVHLVLERVKPCHSQQRGRIQGLFGEVSEFSQEERQTADDVVRGVCNFLGSISLQQKSEVMDGPVLHLRGTAQFYLESKGKYLLEA